MNGINGLPSIGMAIMCKNEESTILKTMGSGLNNGISGWIIYDTGSTDKTLDLIEQFRKDHDASVWIKKGKFVNFSVSRNELLEFADSIQEIDYCFLMDCNDELRDSQCIPDIIRKLSYPSALQVRQELVAGNTLSNTVFFNTRFIKLRDGWRYGANMPVHEFLVPPTGKHAIQLPEPERSQVTIFQDRTIDSHKTRSRFERDEKILRDEIKKSKGKNTRAIYYLAQTLMGMHNYNEAAKYYAKRYRMHVDGTAGAFVEEAYNAAYNAANCIRLGNGSREDYVEWLTKAWHLEHRVDPLTRLALEYMTREDNWTAYMYAHTACSLDYPKNAMLFVDEIAYKYTRWHLLSVICFHLNDSLDILEEGINACKLALAYKPDETDQRNLIAYYKKLTLLYPKQTRVKIEISDNKENNTTLPDRSWAFNQKLIQEKTQSSNSSSESTLIDSSDVELAAESQLFSSDDSSITLSA